MKALIWVSILVFFVFYGCSTDLEETPLTVGSIIDGNTIQIKKLGVNIKLIGIYNTPESKKFLEDNVLNRRILIKYDKYTRRPKIKSGATVSAYTILDTYGGINSEILKLGLSKLNRENLHDSLGKYQKYEDEGLRNENHSIGSSGKSDIASIIKKSEPAIFMVVSMDAQGNGIGQGTGFFIKQGNIGVSNYHVFENGSRWGVKFKDNKWYEVGRIIKSSKTADFVVFEVNSDKSFPYLPIAKSIPAKGEDILVIGNPQGYEYTATKGILSAVRMFNDGVQVIQIDAAISHGSSGSPVMNRNGEVLGIATFKINDCDNCNFAIDINELLK